MLTIVTTPRPLYSGKFRMDFDNAVGSWLHLKPKPQILVFGGERSIVDREGVTFIPNYPKNEQDLPFLDGCLEIAQEMAEYDLIMLTSDHLILRSDFMTAAKELDRRFTDSFAAVGQRWDRQVDVPIDFSNSDWERQIASKQGAGHPRGSSAKDWFLFRLPLPFEIKPFLLGRRRWDSWFLHQLCISGMPVIDVSCVVVPVHPIHGYGHIPLGERAGIGMTTDPGTLHNMALEANTPIPNSIAEVGWGMIPGHVISGNKWVEWKEHNANKNKHEDRFLAAEMPGPLYCPAPVLAE